jgi:hypothetical protein
MKRKASLALAAGLLFYSLSDVLLWQRIFEQHDLFEYQRQFDSGHVTTLVGFMAVGIILLWDQRGWALWYAGAFYTLAFGGVGDVLYYWLDRRSIPGTMPWLDSNPFILFKPAGGFGLVVSAMIWIAIWAAVIWVRPATRWLYDGIGERSRQPSQTRSSGVVDDRV